MCLGQLENVTWPTHVVVFLYNTQSHQCILVGLFYLVTYCCNIYPFMSSVKQSWFYAFASWKTGGNMFLSKEKKEKHSVEIEWILFIHVF